MGLLSKLRGKSAPAPADDAAPTAPAPAPVVTPPTDLTANELSVDALDLMADLIYRSCWAAGWFEPPPAAHDWSDEVVTGVTIRSKHGVVRSSPCDHPGFATFERAVDALNARIAIKMHSKAVDIVFRNYLDVNPDLYELFIDADTRIQVLDTISDISAARKNQYAAFVRDEGVLVVWADDVGEVIPAAKWLDGALVAFVWSVESDVPRLGYHSAAGSLYNLEKVAEEVEDKEGNIAAPAADDHVEDPVRFELESSRKARPRVMIAPVLAGIGAAGAISLMGLGLRSLVIRYIYDGDASRFALAAVLPLLLFVIAFPCSVIVGGFCQILGPIAQFHRNTAFYSAVKPARDSSVPLSSITVQMPVYKEDLADVIIPTIDSLKKAITTYERQGGSVNVIVCDDGLQLLSEEERNRRIQYYSLNNVAYVARPAHGQDGFLRRGRFKKAGNLNYCNTLSWEIEDIMDELRPAKQAELEIGPEQWLERDEREVYADALKIAVDASEGRTWAAGNVRIGEIILLIDSDTRVPEDCFMDASHEMRQSPQVAIIQHASGVMQVAHHFFENGMAFFTNMLQIGISLMVANGEVAPFVGHNAFLRWSALQECAEIDPFDGKPRIWSENHVSEDFQIALTLQTKGWILRWATYSDNQFEEGVSLTCNDERARWQKYAWGCSEIVFNPFRYWFTRGPFTPLFRKFLWSPIPAHSKWSIMAYMFSYYAIAFGWIGSILNFVLIGVFAIQDSFYVDSWEVFFICLLVFQGLSNVGTMILRYRLKLANSGRDALAQIKWMPYFAVFFSGLSLSVAASLVSHLVSYNMVWTSTSKSVEKSNFFQQVPIILRVYWFQITLSVVLLAGMVISTTELIPHNYRVYSMEAILPLAYNYGIHLVWPFLLNPFFTTFSF
ncbi:hypothetical protein Q5752_006506 [Cryptotrichosporon argae]